MGDGTGRAQGGAGGPRGGRPVGDTQGAAVPSARSQADGAGVPGGDGRGPVLGALHPPHLPPQQVHGGIWGGGCRGRSVSTHPPTHPVGVPSRLPQGAQVQPALGVLGDGGGHPRGAEPRGGGAEPRGHLRGAVPQLRPGAPAAPLPPAHLRPGAGALQGGSGDAPGGAVTPLLSPFCSSISCDIPPHPVLPKFLNKWSLRTGSNPISSDTALSASGVSGGVPTADGAGKCALGGLLRVVGGRRWPLLHLGTTWVPTGTLFGVPTAPGANLWSSGAVGRPGNPRLLSRSD